jgi:hypothetical protein
MNDKNQSSSGAHWSFWLIGAITLLYNLAGVANFLSQLNPDTIAAMPEPYRLLIEGRPAWATAAFALAVFGGALGCLLLLVRKSAARMVFIASLAGALVTLIQTLGAAPIEFVIGNLVQLLVTAFLIWYSMLARTKGWTNPH